VLIFKETVQFFVVVAPNLGSSGIDWGAWMTAVRARFEPVTLKLESLVETITKPAKPRLVW
jgi:hypothetical protein